MTREIVLDTETTGMDPYNGDRIIEIGAVELIGHLPSGRTMQFYINPERDIPPEATAVHGITYDFLKDKPVFSQIYSEFLDFIGLDATLVIHNAEFDMKFINWELMNVGYSAISNTRVVDTLTMARKKFPGSPASLDALCRRFEIDNSNRTYHGALLDSQLLAEVYLELLGGRQHDLSLNIEKSQPLLTEQNNQHEARIFRPARPHAASKKEIDAHNHLLGQIKDPVWNKYKA